MLKIIYRFIAALLIWLIILGIWDYFDAHTNNQIIQNCLGLGFQLWEPGGLIWEPGGV